MDVLANDDDDGSNDASDLVEERSSLAQPRNSHEEPERKKDPLLLNPFSSRLIFGFFTRAFKYDRLIPYAFVVLQ